MRDVPEWIGKTDNDRIPDRVRLRVYMRAGGRCSCCSRLILVGEPWDCDHTLALANGGGHRESNLRLILREHHKRKTLTDVAEKAKINTKRKKHLGLKKAKRPMPGSKDSAWKRKMDGTWEKR